MTGMRLDTILPEQMPLLDEGGTRYAWSVLDGDIEALSELAAVGRLDADGRHQARVHKSSAVRAGFASRSDLTAEEVTAVLTCERTASVTAAVLTRPLDPDTLATLAAGGRKSVLDALLLGHIAVHLTTSPAASALVLAYAQALFEQDRMSRRRQEAAGAVFSRIDSATIDALDAIPSWPWLDSLAKNPAVWFSTRRAEILAAAGAGYSVELDFGLRDALARGTVPPLSPKEREILSDVLPQRGRWSSAPTLRALIVDAEELASEREAAQDAARMRAAAERQAKKWARWAKGPDPVFVRAAVREAGASEALASAQAEQILALALARRAASGENLVREWGRPVPTALVNKAPGVQDCWAFIVASRSGREGRRNAHLERTLSEILRGGWAGLSGWKGTSLRLAGICEEMSAEVSMTVLARVLAVLDSDSYALLPCGLMERADSSDTSRQVRARAWLLNQLACVAHECGASPTSVSELARILMTGGQATLGEVVCGVREALGAAA